MNNMARFFQLLATMFLCVLFSSANAQILFNSDWENGDYQSYGWSTSGNPTAAVVEAPNPVCAGNNSINFSLSINEDQNTYRTELTLNNGPLNELKIGNEYWIGYAVFLPKSWAPDTMSEVLFQIHGYPDLSDGEQWRNPPLAIRTGNSSWMLTYAKDAKKLTVDKNYEDSGSIILGDFKTDKWTNIVIHTKWSYLSDGFVEVWIDGKKVGEKTGGIGFNDDRGPYIKTGIYKKAWDLSVDWGGPTDVDSRIYYMDEFKIGDAGTTYDEIVPKCQSEIVNTTDTNNTNTNTGTTAVPTAPSGLMLQLN